MPRSGTPPHTSTLPHTHQGASANCPKRAPQPTCRSVATASPVVLSAALHKASFMALCGKHGARKPKGNVRMLGSAESGSRERMQRVCVHMRMHWLDSQTAR